jgi:hypothetical protein
MSNITKSPVAISIPFDNTTGRGYSSNELQSALEEVRDHTVYSSRTNTTIASTILTLTSTDTNLQFFTGSAAGYIVRLPNATTIPVSSFYQLINTSTQQINIQDAAGNFLFTLSQSSVGYVHLQLGNTVAGTWVYWQVLTTSTASGIINYNITSTTAFSTTSATDVLVTGFSVTPQAGTYAVWVSSTCTNTVNNSLNNLTIYKNSTAATDSKRTYQTGSSNVTFQLASQTIIQVNGTDVVSARVSRNSGTFTINGRSLLLIRLGS